MSIINLEEFNLRPGSHRSISEGGCLLDVASYVAGEPWSDHPECVSPVLRIYGRSLNDSLPSARRQELKQYLRGMLNTAGDGQDKARSYIALDWLIRTYTPAFLDVAGLTAEAAELRSLRCIMDMVAAEAAGPVVRKARDEASAAWAAAWDAARDAARTPAWDAAGAAAWSAAGAASWDAAGAAAWDAALNAARTAAWSAAGVAAGAAAWDAARDAARGAALGAAWDAAGATAWAAARAAFQPTVDSVQTSAIALLGRMINPAEVSE